jgi:hypothetical protein
MKQININKISESKEVFFQYVDICNKNFRSLTPSIYLYRKIFEKQKSAGYRVEKLILDQEFLELMYVTLVAWGMNTRAAKMVDYDTFIDSIKKFGNSISQLEDKELCLLSEDGLERVLQQLKPIFMGLKVMKSKSNIVGVSKTIHFLLPRLVPPMDREYTMNFFYGHVNYKVGDKEFVSFVILLQEFYKIARKINLNSEDVDGVLWNTTVPKLIDNAIIGYISKSIRV